MNCILDETFQIINTRNDEEGKIKTSSNEVSLIESDETKVDSREDFNYHANLEMKKQESFPKCNEISLEMQEKFNIFDNPVQNYYLEFKKIEEKHSICSELDVDILDEALENEQISQVGLVDLSLTLDSEAPEKNNPLLVMENVSKLNLGPNKMELFDDITTSSDLYNLEKTYSVTNESGRREGEFHLGLNYERNKISSESDAAFEDMSEKLELVFSNLTNAQKVSDFELKIEDENRSSPEKPGRKSFCSLLSSIENELECDTNPFPDKNGNFIIESLGSRESFPACLTNVPFSNLNKKSIFDFKAPEISSNLSSSSGTNFKRPKSQIPMHFSQSFPNLYEISFEKQSLEKIGKAKPLCRSACEFAHDFWDSEGSINFLSTAFKEENLKTNEYFSDHSLSLEKISCKDESSEPDSLEGSKILVSDSSNHSLNINILHSEQYFEDQIDQLDKEIFFLNEKVEKTQSTIEERQTQLLKEQARYFIQF